jgi:N-acetylglucosamine kinase-like BadF-type ATPase
MLQAVYRAALGIDPPTALTERVLAATGEPSVEALLHGATRRDVVLRREPGDLAWILLDAADDADPTAVAIVERHGTGLAATALAAARQVGIAPGDPFRLALTGGVFRHRAAVLRDAIVRGVRLERPAVDVVQAADEPAVGALLLAFDAAGIVVDEAIHDRIRRGLASADLFDTHPFRLASA